MRAENHRAREPFHARNMLVGVLGIVMEEKEPPHAGFDGEGHAVLEATVTPAAVLLVFSGVILGINNENLRNRE